jgi:SAM-dependent methyltransferase
VPDNVVSVDFRRHLPIRPGDLVLDVGCGEGRHTSEICLWDCHAVGVDLSLDDVKVAKYVLSYKRWAHEAIGLGDFMAADAEHLPFEDATFDRIVCTEVLEHIPDDKAAIRELVRVLKPGGLMAVSVPNYLPEVLFWTISWGYWHSPGGHIRIYKPGEMVDALREGGLEVYAERRRHSIQSFYWFLRCAFGVNNENFFITKYLNKVLQVHYWLRLRSLEYVESFVDLVLGKDLILYGRKPSSLPD